MMTNDSSIKDENTEREIRVKLPSSLATSLPTLLASTSSTFSARLTTAAIASLSLADSGGSLRAALHPVRSLIKKNILDEDIYLPFLGVKHI